MHDAMILCASPCPLVHFHTLFLDHDAHSLMALCLVQHHEIGLIGLEVLGQPMSTSAAFARWESLPDQARNQDRLSGGPSTKNLRTLRSHLGSTLVPMLSRPGLRP
jgi:hypothetical protein